MGITFGTILAAIAAAATINAGEVEQFPDGSRVAFFGDSITRNGGATIQDAALRGADLRYRAVMMTAWSFIIGVLPLVFAHGAGAGAMRGIGICTCSGMLAATVFGIAFVPALYAFFERMARRRPRLLAACAVFLLCSQGCMAAEEPEAAVRTEPMRVTLTFERHLDDIAALEREGKIVVTDSK